MAARATAGRREEILRAAGELFHARGFHGVGVDEIGRAAGVSGPAVYQYFKGKDEILAQLFDHAMDLVDGADAAAAPRSGPDADGGGRTGDARDREDDPRAALERLVARHARFVASHRAMVSIFAHEYRFLVDPWRRPFARRMRAHGATWESTIASVHPEAPAEAVAVTTQAAIGLMHSVVLWPDAPRDEDRLAARIAALALGAIDTLAPDAPAALRPQEDA